MYFKDFIYFYPENPTLVHRDQPLIDEFEGLVMKDLTKKFDLGRKSNTESKWMYKMRKSTNSYRY